MLDMDKFTLHSHDTVLMIIDIQQRLASVMERREQVITNTGILIEANKRRSHNCETVSKVWKDY